SRSIRPRSPSSIRSRASAASTTAKTSRSTMWERSRMRGKRPPRGLLVGGAALLVVLALALLLPAVARALAAFLLVLLLPGVAITAAVFPPGRLSGAEWVTYGLGTSLAVAALGGLVLHWTPWGLSAGAWVVLLGAITLAAGAIAVRHWRRAADRDAE